MSPRRWISYQTCQLVKWGLKWPLWWQFQAIVATCATRRISTSTDGRILTQCSSHTSWHRETSQIFFAFVTCTETPYFYRRKARISISTGSEATKSYSCLPQLNTTLFSRTPTETQFVCPRTGTMFFWGKERTRSSCTDTRTLKKKEQRSGRLALVSLTKV